MKISFSVTALVLSGFLAAAGAQAQDGGKTTTSAAAPAAQADAKKDEAKKDEKKADAKKADAKKDEKKTDAKKDDKKGDKAKADGGAAKAASTSPVVELKTSLGTVKIQLDEKAAPETVKNFLSYVNDKHYDGTIFHRVIENFMIQGGGYKVEGGKLVEKPTKAPIKNEAKNGLRNDRGTIAMARTPDPDSATAQFFINHRDNDSLNYPKPDNYGYAVFGKVIEGMDVVDKIAAVKTGMKDGMQDVPLEEVKIISATVAKPNS